MKPEEIVDALLSDLGDRSGFSLDSVDDVTVAEWRADWVRLVTRDEVGLTVRDLVQESYGTAKDKGWHDEDDQPPSEAMCEIAAEGLRMCMISRRVEAHRKGQHPGRDDSFVESILGCDRHVATLSDRQVRTIAWLALVSTEVAEAIDDVRAGRWQTTTNEKGKPEGLGSELADIIIRVCDDAGALGIDLEAELRAKLAYNKTRSIRHGGKLA